MLTKCYDLYLELVESVDVSDDDKELFRRAGRSFVFDFGGRPRAAGDLVLDDAGFLFVLSPSLSELLPDANKSLNFDFISSSARRVSVLFRPFLAAAADLHIWCCFTTAGGAFPPVGGNDCCGGGLIFGLDDGVDVFALIACAANVFFLISFCMRFASACSTFDAGSSSSLEKNSEIFAPFLVAGLSFD